MGFFLLRHIKAAHLFGLFYLCRQNVTHSVCCRKSIWRPFIQAHCLTGS
nr:MAG TPA: hypothetical protein [Caudoviricetes sp.]DAM23592.1 MAG TPA: hypothetical protein [Caudoviricetes sp.]